MKPILSILVPTLACRHELLGRLIARLSPQVGDDCVVNVLRDDGQETIGRKRQRLLESSVTPFVSFVDDDDLVSPDYCRKVIAAIRSGCDVVGFRLNQYDDGELSAHAIHTVAAKRWYTDVATGIHYRTPNHLNPVRRKMALAVGYLDRNNGEDSDYSERLFAAFPNMREAFIDADLYLYFRRTVRLGERCNPKP